MPITLSEQVISVNRILTGSETFDVASGEFFKIEKTGVEILSETIPAGKQWSVTATVRIEESDA